MLRSRAWGVLIVAAVGAVVLLLLSVRGVLDHVALYDELLHVLAARGLLETGAPVIADGLYPRAELYSRLVAWMLPQFSDDLVAARVPALVAGATLVAMTAVWVGRRAGLLAGASAAVLLCVVPQTIELSVFGRFYTLHALVICAAYAAVYEAMLPDRTRAARIAFVALAIVLLPLAWHLQETTLIAAGAGVAGAIVLAIVDRWPAVKALIKRHPVALPGALALLLALALFAIWRVGLFEQLVASPLWAADRAQRYHYYLVAFRDSIPLLWPLLPIATAVAFASGTHRRLAVYSAVIVVSALVVHSVAGAKAVRYVYYLAPFMCVLWALTLAAIAERAAGHVRSNGQSDVVVGAVSALVLLGLALLMSQEGSRLLKLAAGRAQPEVALTYGVEADWSRVAANLEPQVSRADRLVTSNAMKALYYLGDYDFELNASIVLETDTGEEFGRDMRTGRHAMGAAASVRRVIDAPGSTLVVLEVEKIGKQTGVPSGAVAVIETACAEISLPAGSGVRAWSCPSTRRP